MTKYLSKTITKYFLYLIFDLFEKREKTLEY